MSIRTDLEMDTFSYGGGVQSTAVLVLAATGRVEVGTFLFCNVGHDSERKRTLEYVDTWAIPYARQHDLPFEVLQRVVSRGPNKGPETLYGRLTREGSRSLPIPVRMPDTGAPGTRSCTADFKIRVVAGWLRKHGASGSRPMTTGLGISLDEVQRARTDSGIVWQQLTYPLLGLRLRRSDCREIITAAGLPVPPKSACWFCPLHKPSEWRRMLHEEPEEFERAAQLEDTLNERRAMLGRDPVYLTRFGAPLRQVIHDDQLDLFDAGEYDCETGYCHV